MVFRVRNGPGVGGRVRKDVRRSTIWVSLGWGGGGRRAKRACVLVLNSKVCK